MNTVIGPGTIWILKWMFCLWQLGEILRAIKRRLVGIVRALKRIHFIKSNIVVRSPSALLNTYLHNIYLRSQRFGNQELFMCYSDSKGSTYINILIITNLPYINIIFFIQLNLMISFSLHHESRYNFMVPICIIGFSSLFVWNRFIHV